jgi:chaperonin cofactor prefoldin
MDKLLEEYSTADAIAEEIISEKHQISDLDRKRNSAREALHHIKKVQPKTASSASWICFGNTFIKMDTPSSIKMLEEDYKQLSTEMEKLREGLKPKVAALHKLEGKAEAKGFNLQGMRTEELLNL